MNRICIPTIISIILILGFYIPVSAITILFWDDFEDGTWEDKWLNAAQGSYEIIDAAEYKNMYGHFPLDDPNNKGVLIFGGGEGGENSCLWILFTKVKIERSLAL